jgi:hypothetical protein
VLVRVGSRVQQPRQPDDPTPPLSRVRARGCFQRILDTMSVYASFGIFDGEEENHPAPLIYRQSHIIPSPDDPRGGSFELGAIPAFLTRSGYDDGADEDAWWPYLRVSLLAGEPDEDTIVLDAEQVRALRDELTDWLERIDPDLK